MIGRFDRASSWLTIAELASAAATPRRRRGVQARPGASAGRRLWVGLGNALVAHADGMMSPAAELAFDRADRLAPEHPAPRFFYGLALAQGGQFDQAEGSGASCSPKRPRRRISPDHRRAAAGGPAGPGERQVPPRRAGHDARRRPADLRYAIDRLSSAARQRRRFRRAVTPPRTAGPAPRPPPVADLAAGDVEAVGEMRIGFHCCFSALVGELENEWQASHC